MKKYLLILLLTFFTIELSAQKPTTFYFEFLNSSKDKIENFFGRKINNNILIQPNGDWVCFFYNKNNICNLIEITTKNEESKDDFFNTINSCKSIVPNSDNIATTWLCRNTYYIEYFIPIDNNFETLKFQLSKKIDEK